MDTLTLDNWQHPQPPLLIELEGMKVTEIINIIYAIRKFGIRNMTREKTLLLQALNNYSFNLFTETATLMLTPPQFAFCLIAVTELNATRNEDLLATLNSINQVRQS